MASLVEIAVWEVVLLLDASLDQSIPVLVLLQGVLVAYDPEEVLRAGDGYVHPPVVVEESKPMRSNRRNDDDLFLSALVRINCVDFDVVMQVLRGDTQFMLDAV